MVALVEFADDRRQNVGPAPEPAPTPTIIDRLNPAGVSTGLSDRSGIADLIDSSRRDLGLASTPALQPFFTPIPIPLATPTPVPTPSATPAEVFACKVGNAIVVGIDGTGSASYRKEPGASPQFVEQILKRYDTGRGDKFYHDGPENGQRLPSTFGEDSQIENSAYQFLTKRHAECPDQPIDLYGYSRGGFIAMQLAHRLAKDGIEVRHVGLLDPVDSDLGYGEAEGLPKNVKDAAVVVAAPSEYKLDCGVVRAGCVIEPTYIQSRSYFNRADTDPAAPDVTKVERRVLHGTHAALGGAPGTGDHPLGYTPDGDRAAGEEAGRFTFDAAKRAGARFVTSPSDN